MWHKEGRACTGTNTKKSVAPTNVESMGLPKSSLVLLQQNQEMQESLADTSCMSNIILRKKRFRIMYIFEITYFFLNGQISTSSTKIAITQ